MAKDTFPVPSGMRIWETYRKVIRGNTMDDMVKMAFMTKLSFRDWVFFTVSRLPLPGAGQLGLQAQLFLLPGGKPGEQGKPGPGQQPESGGLVDLPVEGRAFLPDFRHHL